VLVNDGSRDGTLAALQALADRDPHVVVVNLSRNHGHQLALTAGLSVARGDLIFILDADLQDPPELLPEMLARIEDGADVVYGQRRERAGESAFKKLSAKAFYRLISRLSAVDIPVDTGDFRLMTRRVLEVLAAMPEQHRFVRGMVSWVGFRQEPLLYDRDPRFAGETKYPLRKMIGFASDALTGFSVVPLRLAFYLGLLGGLASVALLLYSLIAYMLDDTVTGWTSMMTVVLFVSSIQMIMLGILGEYVGRIFMQSKQRPLFVIESVRRQTDGEPAPHPHEAA
jgi:dolichol-phosphate mannosyltransferase